MVTLDELLNAGDSRTRARDRFRTAGRQLLAATGAGLYWAGWALFHVVRLPLLAVGAVCWALGFVARRVVWPALVWCAAAVRLGWEDGRRSVGERTGERAERARGGA